MKCIALVAGVAACLFVAWSSVLSRTSQPPLPPGVTGCAFDAYSNDPDPNGLNVRANPNAQSPVLGRLPDAESPVAGGPVAAEFHVIGTRNGWFLIEGAHYRYGYRTRKAQPYSGRGWVSGTLITTGVRRLFLKSAPSANASNVVKLLGPGGGPSEIHLDAILGCSGNWFRVEIPLKGQVFKLTPLLRSDAPAGYVRGWTDSYCTDQLTTCV
jgi:hypothetical protein